MRIAVLTSSYPRYKGDGVAPFIKSISESLYIRGHKIKVVAPYDVEVKSDPKSKFEVHRFKYVLPKTLHIMGHARSLNADIKLKPIVPFILPLFIFASIYNLFKICKKMNAEVIYAHWVLPNGLPAAIVSKLLKIPLILSLHGSDIFIANKNFLYKLFAKWVFSKSFFITACSPELYQKAKTINPNIDIQIVPYGADPEIFQPINNREEIRLKYGWDPSEVIISTLGRFVYKKGFSNLISIAAKLRVEKNNFRVMIGGSGPLEEKLKLQVEQLHLQDIISFPGQVPWHEVPKYFSASDIFVLPSQRDIAGNLDGLPNVLLEAMACGLPCIANNIGGVSLVISDGINGFISDPLNDDSIMQLLINLIDSEELRKSAGIQARKTIIEKYNWNSFTKIIEHKIEVLRKN